MLHHSSRISPKTRFCLKLLLLILPLIPIVVVYFMFDPYRVLHPYKRFDDSPMLLNEAHVGWQNYLQNRDSIVYNSFILGNSCTMAFLTGEWENTWIRTTMPYASMTTEKAWAASVKSFSCSTL